MKIPLFEIHLFGEFRLLHRGQLVTSINSARMQSLLAYLLLHRQAPQPRQQIAFLLWPDTGEAQARNNLRNLLHRLRQTLPGGRELFNEDHQTIHWRTEIPTWLDTEEFEAAAALARQADRPVFRRPEDRRPEDGPAEDGPAALAAYEKAVQLVQGELLPSCYDEWILPHRERFHQLYLEALERLVTLLENSQSYRQAISYAQRWLYQDPLNEETYRRLMRLHAQNGDLTSAMRVYNTCVSVLERELSIPPSPPTLQAYDSIRAARGAPPSAPKRTRSAAQTPGNLPHPLTSFIGREAELAQVADKLQSTRLLTLTGAPGSGKTRLGVETARRVAGAPGAYPDGVWWFDLTASKDLSQVAHMVAAALNVRETLGEELLQTLASELRQRTLLLVLDNCEHLIDPISRLSTTLLQACPGLTMILTSREAAGIRGETVYMVPPLTYPQGEDLSPPTGPGPRRTERSLPDSQQPNPLDSINRYEAVHLFVERATAALPTFRLTSRNASTVAQICTQLQGIPLALELAAARVKMLSVEQIAGRMDSALHLLKTARTSGMARHQTLQAALDWSYNLLSEQEQALLRVLAVFAGGFTLEAVERVVGETGWGEEPGSDAFVPALDVLDLLSRLIDKSLVMVAEQDQASEARYSLLETVRQYACEKLELAGETAIARRRHALYILELAETADQNLRSPEQSYWVERLEGDHDNSLAALGWAVEHALTDEEFGLRLITALWQFWDVHGYFIEGRQWQAAILAKSTIRNLVRAKAVKGAGGLAWSQGDYLAARSLLSESLDLAREFGEKRDVAVGLFNLGVVSYTQGDYPAALKVLEESLEIFRELEHKLGIANVLNSMGAIYSDQGDFGRAKTLLQESLTLRREQEDRRGTAFTLGNLGSAELRQGNPEAARQLLQECLQVYQEIGDKRGIATTLTELGSAVLLLGEAELARNLYLECLPIWSELDSKAGLATTLEGAAGLAFHQSDCAQAARLLGAAATVRRQLGSPLPPADQQLLDGLVSAIQAQAGAECFANAYQIGRSLSLEEARQEVRSL